jgi:osmotically-inducible protein OsmY
VNVSDADARAAIRDAFAADPRVPRTTVDFDVKYGVVTLTGVVASLSEKLAATEDARRAIGVTAVVNQIQVRPWAASGSAGLEQGVLARLKQHPYVDARNVRARADGTVIALDGSVGSEFERRTAERVAGAVAGVSEVKNQLAVASGRRNYRDDEELRREVENALYWDRRVGDPKLTVGVVGGVVTVRGEVPNAEVYDAILQDIFELSPARLVNELSLPARERPQRPNSPQG